MYCETWWHIAPKFIGESLNLKKKVLYLASAVILFILLCSCSNKSSIAVIKNSISSKDQRVSDRQDTTEISHEKSKSNEKTIEIDFKDLIINKYKDQKPLEWGEKVSGVKTRIDTKDKIIALTFDACGGRNGTQYDKKLIDFLVQERVPATLFINSRWIDANYSTFMELAGNNLFEIENHGFTHNPLSVNGKSIYGIKGTKNVDEIFDEVFLNEQKIFRLTGRKPIFFRSGTAYDDEVAVKIVNEIGEDVINFNVIGDAGATYSRAQIVKACINAVPGSIIILHMNRPDKHTAQGIIEAVPELKKRGFKLVKLQDYRNNLK